MDRKCNLMTGEISLCSGCGCMTNDILGSDGIYCGKCKTQKHAQNKNEHGIGCGLIVAKTRDGEVKCGQEMFGKKRYCAYCSQVTSKSKEKIIMTGCPDEMEDVYDS